MICKLSRNRTEGTLEQVPMFNHVHQSDAVTHAVRRNSLALDRGRKGKPQWLRMGRNGLPEGIVMRQDDRLRERRTNKDLTSSSKQTLSSSAILRVRFLLRRSLHLLGHPVVSVDADGPVSGGRGPRVAWRGVAVIKLSA